MLFVCHYPHCFFSVMICNLLTDFPSYIMNLTLAGMMHIKINSAKKDQEMLGVFAS
jgi:hypothetical protein